MTLDTIRILGYEVLNEPAQVVAAAVCDSPNGTVPKSFVFLNPHSVVVAEQDPAMRAALVGSDAIFCDGVGLSIASRILNRNRVHRVYGYDFFLALSSAMSERQEGRVFFLGGTNDSIRDLLSRFRAQFPGIRHVEGYAPPFKAVFSREDIDDMAKRVAASQANVLWVGLGSPKQEKIMLELVPLCHLKCAGAIGAVFDFYTDRVPHAPAWVRNLGLQWIHRLVLEPGRLWKRTFVSMPLFLWYVVLDLLGLRRR
jgi:N-acetylglucosaminyldiphosphoundecaprenol N-acetyl-beta-D-mannosaminyltransferase